MGEQQGRGGENRCGPYVFAPIQTLLFNYQPRPANSPNLGGWRLSFFIYSKSLSTGVLAASGGQTGLDRKYDHTKGARFLPMQKPNLRGEHPA